MSHSSQRVLLLGASGSIGRQTLDILKQHPEDFTLVGISAGHQEKALDEIIQDFPSIQWAGLSTLLPNQVDQKNAIQSQVKWIGGKDQMTKLVQEADYDILVNAVVGFRGLKPTLEAIQKNKIIALANKESLVCGGELVKQALKSSTSTLRPIDSEHSAIWQCLQGNKKEDIERLIITASGGSLRDVSREKLRDITPKQALKHPSWSMGPRITIDSATMVNKGFEVIEAHYLFDLPYEQIATVLHPQSIVHSLVEYKDHACIAQLGSADMRLPIQYALYGPDRPYFKENAPLDMTKALTLTFQEMDFERYPLLKTAYEVGTKKGNTGCIFNAADEKAVELFLKGQIPFLFIEELILLALENIPWLENPSYSDLEETDRQTRLYVQSMAEAFYPLKEK
ncbi:MAG: 1-deoxy-D-xylulose-5-phosphate reductoisomerase [Allobaculum sp.]|nr:1-deoxy-D-xylulose-5-phosphate reductoisomerase [Allobaculum sp.]